MKVTYKPTINHLMSSVNLVTFAIAGSRLILNGELLLSLNFCLTHPSVIIDLLVLAILQILGQVSIYFVVINFKQHMFPLISTTRKVFTVILSIYFYNHKVVIYQWIALVMVFGGMIYELADELYYDITGEKKIRIKKLKS